MKVHEFIQQLAKKAGVTETDEIRAFLKTVEAIDIPESLHQGIGSGLFTLEAAKANADISKHFKAQVLAGADAEIEKQLAELGFTEDQISDIKNEKNSFAKIGMSFKKIKALTTPKQGEKDTNNDSALKAEIEKLNGLLKQTADKHTQELTALRQSAEQERLNYALESFIAGFPLAGDQPDEFKRKFAAQFLQTQLATKKAKLELKDGQLTLLNSETGADYFDAQNNKLDAKSFAEKVLAESKFLRANTPTQTPTPPIVGGSNGNKIDTHQQFQQDYYNNLLKNSMNSQ